MLFILLQFFFNFCLGNTKISNLVFRGFVQTSEVSPVSASMHPRSSASAVLAALPLLAGVLAREFMRHCREY